MSRQAYDDDCPGCRPVLIDPGTMEKLPVNHPAMRAINTVWAGLTLDERRAWHRFTCQNSRAPEDLRVVAIMQERFAGETDRGRS